MRIMTLRLTSVPCRGLVSIHGLLFHFDTLKKLVVESFPCILTPVLLLLLSPSILTL